MYPTTFAQIQLFLPAQRKIRQIQKSYNKDHDVFPPELLVHTSVAVDTNTVPYARALTSYFLGGLISDVYQQGRRYGARGGANYF